MDSLKKSLGKLVNGLAKASKPTSVPDSTEMYGVSLPTLSLAELNAAAYGQWVTIPRYSVTATGMLGLNYAMDPLSAADPAAKKKAYESFMGTCRQLLARNIDWQVAFDVNDPLVVFSLVHPLSGTTVKLNYPFNEVLVEGRAAFIKRTITEIVPMSQFDAFCKGRSKTL